MADEEMEGLEGLDDFGDDFGDQLDSFMEGEGDESDSELDSFFEDLSTIDDLEVQEAEPVADDDLDEAPAPEAHDDLDDEDDEGDSDMGGAATAAAPVAAAAVAAAAVDEDEKPAKEKKKKQKEKKQAGDGEKRLKPLLIPALISAVVGMVLGAITVVLLMLLNAPDEPPIPEQVVLEAPMPEPIILATPLAEPEFEPEPVFEPEPAQPKPKSKPKIRYYVQVANCIHKECVEDYQFLLKRFGYASKVEPAMENAPMTEITTANTLREEDAAQLVEHINKKSRLVGVAYRKATKRGYVVSLGLYPDLDKANRVKTYLNQAYGSNIVFEAQRADQKIRYKKIRAGGFASKKEAEALKRLLIQKDKRFEGTFVVAMKR